MTNADIISALRLAGFYAVLVQQWDFIHVWSDTTPRGWLTVELHTDDEDHPLRLCLDEPDTMWPFATLEELVREVPRALAAWVPVQPGEGQP